MGRQTRSLFRCSKPLEQEQLQKIHTTNSDLWLPQKSSTIQCVFNASWMWIVKRTIANSWLCTRSSGCIWIPAQPDSCHDHGNISVWTTIVTCRSRRALCTYRKTHNHTVHFKIKAKFYYSCNWKQLPLWRWWSLHIWTCSTSPTFLQEAAPWVMDSEIPT